MEQLITLSAVDSIIKNQKTQNEQMIAMYNQLLQNQIAIMNNQQYIIQMLQSKDK